MPSRQQVKAYSLRTVLLILVLAATAMFVVGELLFTVRSVAVEGNARISSGEIAELAGLTRHRSWLFLREDAIKTGIETNPYLVYDHLEKIFPNRVVIHVRERVPRAWLTALGKRYALDEEGVVLSVLPDGDEANDLIALTGLTVRDMSIGSRATYVNGSQMHAYTDLMSEILVQNAAASFVSMNVADSNNVYLTSVSGFEISLGKAEEFRAKLLSVRGVLEYAVQFGLAPGGLDASVPGYVTYSP
ncbi:MAG: FtsQ-type POTRA domain-containing protein [Clostridia bacterium]|nr:FtsQ-type POTRA domain-containing protein [Clostridia bacterium]